MKKLLLNVFALVVFAACSKEPPVEFIPAEGETSIGEKAAADAGNFFRERTGGLVPEIKINAGGSASLLKKDGGELARFFWFENGSRIAVLPEGYYTTPGDSFSGAVSKIRVKTKNGNFLLSQFSALFYRPDTVDSFIKGESAPERLTFTIDSLLREGKIPPELYAPEAGGNLLSFKVKTASEGGFIAFWEKTGDGAPEKLAAFMDIEKTAKNKYSRNGFFFYEAETEMPRGLASSLIGVSVFNGERTMESERFWFQNKASARLSPAGALTGNTAHTLRVLFAGEEFQGFKDIEELFAAQEYGGLYSNVKLYKTKSSGAEDFLNVLGEFVLETEENDTAACFLNIPVSHDALGNYSFFGAGPAGGLPENVEAAASQGTAQITSWELTENFLKLKSGRLLLIIRAAGMSPLAEETAFLRLGQHLGLKTLMANFRLGDETGGAAGVETFTLPAQALNKKHISAIDFISFIQERFNVSQKNLKILNAGDFPFLNATSGYGEIKMQTMFSGMVKIEGIDEAPSVLTFGETLRREVPPGLYQVTMTYRNGYRETKTAEAGRDNSKWLIFNYTPGLLESDFSRLPAFGVNIGELNPGNYRKTEPAVLAAMEAPEWRISFLRGEELYRKGDYDGAIAEYTKSISLKSDYVSPYVSRGNSYRRKGDPGRAIKDYTNAIALKNDYAELYNYRGYLYGQTGDLARAEADYTKAIKLRGNYADAIFNRAYNYMKQEKWEAAAADYTRVITLEPRNAAAYDGRGRALLNKGDTAASASDFGKAASLEE